jgi:hypothetical protein
LEPLCMAAFFQHKDGVGMHDGRQAVGDQWCVGCWPTAGARCSDLLGDR